LTATALQNGGPVPGTKAATVSTTAAVCGYKRFTGTLTSFPYACVAANGFSTFAGSVSVLDSQIYTTLPFEVSLFSSPASTSATISTHGWMAIGGQDSSARFNNVCPLPAGGLLGFAYVFAYWDDSYTGPAGICYATLGTKPNRQYVVTWDASFLYITASSAIAADTRLTYSIILYEASKNVDVAYGTFTNVVGTSASIGIQNSAANQAVTQICNPTSPVSLSNTLTRYVWSTLP
jgi:hypothetical protein